jgi:hypothetical protein
MIHAVDMECADWTEFVLGVACSESGYVRVFDDIGDMLRWYLSLGRSDVVLAHNGGAYDFLALLDADSGAHRWHGVLAGSALVSLRAAGCAELRDTFRLFPMSLRTWTGTKEETGLPCECGRDCGGYCSIRRDMPAAQRRRLIDYCVHDAQALLGAYLRDTARLEAAGYAMRGRDGLPRRTIGGVAVATARRMCGLSDRSVSWAEYHAQRRGYYGGRCEVFRVAAPAIQRYDLSSAYPWALTLPVPVGEPRYVRGAAAARALARGRPGLYEAVVDVPGDLPLLPVRGATRLVWATGTVRDCWPLPELREALAAGAVVRQVVCALVWPDEETVYAPYVEHVWACRELAAARGDHAMHMWHKLAGNALSGKLAQGAGCVTLYVGDRPPDRAEWLGGRAWALGGHRVPPCARPVHAAYLTGRVRARLLEALRSVDPVYCDTDSVYCTSGAPGPVGLALGEWRDEGSARQWRALGPKMYSYLLRSGPVVRAKGVHGITPGGFESLIRGGRVTIDDGVCGIREAYHRFGRAFARAKSEYVRNPTGLCGGREVLSDGRTAAVRILPDGSLRWPSGRAVTPRDERLIGLSRT